MKTLTKSIILALTALTISASSISAIDQSTKLQLLEEALVESATTPAQQNVVSAYMKNVAQEKLELAKEYRERANAPKAGKVAYKNAERKDLLKKAARLENEAKRYQNY
ncbi:MAG: hypothetical protein GW938_14630 [Leptospira sp.]|jgi:hypothetical protein|nr:hypothetical protein [Leptospira sp.]NCS95508.1 hypothetical protein [Leptospira sp.]